MNEFKDVSVNLYPESTRSTSREINPYATEETPEHPNPSIVAPYIIKKNSLFIQVNPFHPSHS